jgi:nucleotide-binding universal stress UspA family protein
MKRGLVAVNDTDAGRELLREAGTFAKGAEAELVLLFILPQEEYDEHADAIEAAEDVRGVYGVDRGLTNAEEMARAIGDEEIGDLGVPFEAVGSLGSEDSRHRRILDTAERRDCDHVFLVGRRRSPTGKALFGETAQQVILDFPGRVTVSMTE